MKQEKQRKKKLESHFYIIVNNKRVKILNYKIEDKFDGITEQGVRILTLISKVPNEVLTEEVIDIHILTTETDIKVRGMYKGQLSQPGLKRYLYEIQQN